MMAALTMCDFDFFLLLIDFFIFWCDEYLYLSSHCAAFSNSFSNSQNANAMHAHTHTNCIVQSEKGLNNGIISI